MMNHLSQDQLSMWILGRYTAEELRHGRECPLCRAELARFEAPVLAFRSAMRDWSDGESAPRIEEVSKLLRRPQSIFTTSWSWVAVGLAMILLATVPIYKQQALMQRLATGSEILPLPVIDAAADANADAMLMDEVSAHLSRTIPSSMERILVLIPTQEDAVHSGGTK